MATSSAMKSSLVLLVLLSGVVASHAHEVSCKNSCNDPIWLNGKICLAGQSITVAVVAGEIAVVVIDLEGEEHSGKYKCPTDVQALEFQYNKATGFLECKITALLLVLGEILKSVLGTVSNLFSCNLH